MDYSGVSLYKSACIKALISGGREVNRIVAAGFGYFVTSTTLE
jgi:hypothetical protein